MQQVVITGMGVICPLGLNTKEYWESLSTGKLGISLISKFDTTNFAVKVAGEIKGFDPEDHMDRKTVQRNPRAVHMSVPAVNQAMEQSGIDMSKEHPERVGVISASMLEYHYVGEDWERLKKHGPRRVNPLLFTQAGPSTVSLQTGMMLGAQGPNITINCLCASGTETIATASNYIRSGQTDIMLAIGSDASLSEMGIAATSILGALTKEPDPAKASRPFDVNRSGFVYAEGCGVVVLESMEHARKRGARILAEVAGAGSTFDAYDSTAPNSETEANAMKLALKSAGMKPDEIDYINAHGTSTRLNDVSETRALKMALGDVAYKVPISSFKSMFGHQVTAAGIVESIGVVMAMENGLIPATINYESPDPDCDLDYVPNTPRKAEINSCLKNSFGLGGQNCCLVIKKYRE